MNHAYFLRISATAAAAAFIASVILIALYLLKLPIFDSEDLAWLLLYALCAFGVAVFVLFVRGIWDH